MKMNTKNNKHNDPTSSNLAWLGRDLMAKFSLFECMITIMSEFLFTEVMDIIFLWDFPFFILQIKEIFSFFTTYFAGVFSFSS